MVTKEIEQDTILKIGHIEVPVKIENSIQKMYFELIGDYVHQKYTSVKSTNPDTLQSYAFTAFEIAKDQFDLEKKLEEKLNKLDAEVSDLIEQIDTAIQ